MKKTYQKPEMLIARLATQGIIADSGAKGTTVYDDTADPSKPSLSRRRRRNQWDDEEDEEW